MSVRRALVSSKWTTSTAPLSVAGRTCLCTLTPGASEPVRGWFWQRRKAGTGEWPESGESPHSKHGYDARPEYHSLISPRVRAGRIFQDVVLFYPTVVPVGLRSILNLLSQVQSPMLFFPTVERNRSQERTRPMNESLASIRLNHTVLS